MTTLEERKVCLQVELGTEVHWLQNLVAKTVINEKKTEIIGSFEKILTLMRRVHPVGTEIFIPFTSLCVDIFTRTNGQLDNNFMLNVLALWSDNIFIPTLDVKLKVFQKLVKHFHKFAKLIPNIGHGSVQKQMLEIILDYVTYKSNRLKDMFNYVPNIDGELQRFLDDEGNTDTNMKQFLMCINDAVDGQVITYPAKSVVFRDRSLYASAGHLLWVDFNMQTSNMVITFDAASINADLFENGKTVSATIEKATFFSVTSDITDEAETYTISLMLEFNAPPKVSDAKLQRKIWYVNTVELLLPHTESEPDRLKFQRVQKLLCLWRNIPEPDLSGLREQLKGDWKKWLDNPNLKLEWLAECKARDEAEERKRLELAKQDEEIAINQMQIDCSMIDERNTIVIVDDDDDDLDRVDQAGISSSNA